jgi:hypothetical protein
MKKIVTGILIATTMTSSVMAQVVDQFKVWSDKEPDPEKYKPRRTTTHTETTTTTTTVRTLPQRTVYVERQPANPAPIQKCVKNGKTIYSNEGC